MIKEQKDLREMAAAVRQDVIKMTFLAGKKGGHLGGALSMCEMMAALYGKIMRCNANDPKWEGRDRLILSKGHGALALYSALAQMGYIPYDDLWKYKEDDFYLSMHPRRMPECGLECASGSLGQGLSIAVGMASALKLKGNNESRVFVILGDGEIDEGSVWEGAAAAAQFRLSNLVCIVDWNKVQNDGFCKEIMSMEDIAGKWSSFGWEVKNVDGHDVDALVGALECCTQDKPLVIVADTVKGKGVSFAENDYRWHNAALNEAQYRQAMLEQGVEIDGI